MNKEIRFTHRYVVRRKVNFDWEMYTSHRFLWRAKQVARFRQSLGYFEYKVIDTKS